MKTHRRRGAVTGIPPTQPRQGRQNLAQGARRCEKIALWRRVVGATLVVAPGRPQGPPLQRDFFTPSKPWVGLAPRESAPEGAKEAWTRQNLTPLSGLRVYCGGPGASFRRRLPLNPCIFNLPSSPSDSLFPNPFVLLESQICNILESQICNILESQICNL